MAFPKLVLLSHLLRRFLGVLAVSCKTRVGIAITTVMGWKMGLDDLSPYLFFIFLILPVFFLSYALFLFPQLVFLLLSFSIDIRSLLLPILARAIHLPYF